ncbi:MAG: hypothetical protein Q9226_005181 [Calogaya cf. arnoldii]
MTGASAAVPGDGQNLEIRGRTFTYTYYDGHSDHSFWRNQSEIKRFLDERAALQSLSDQPDHRAYEASQQLSDDKVVEVHWTQEMAKLASKAEGWEMEMDQFKVLMERVERHDDEWGFFPLCPPVVLLEEAFTTWFHENPL